MSVDQKPFHSEGKNLGGGSLSPGPSSTNSDSQPSGTEADVDPEVTWPGVRPDSSEERPSGPAALPGGLSRPSTPTFPGKLFKMQNSPSLSLQDTVHNYPFSMSYLTEKDSLKKKN